jgi:hypothetical protein
MTAETKQDDGENILPSQLKRFAAQPRNEQ